jgi:hypothetical protein
MMQLRAGQAFLIVDREQKPIGEIALERGEGNLLFGKFRPGPAFPAVAHLFRAFEEAVNSQALPIVDELDSAIAALGLQLRSVEDASGIEIHDVQIWSDDAMTCRTSGPALVAANGSPDSTQSAESVRK